MPFEHLLADLKSIVFREQDAADVLPVMDGPWTPNRGLDVARTLGPALPGCDDLAAGADGRAFVSADRAIWSMSTQDLATRSLYAECEHAVGALLAQGDTLYAALEDRGVVRLDAAARETARLDRVAGRPLRCVTALAALPDGRLLIADGSARHPASRWTHDLMEKGASGRIVLAAADLSQASVLADGLAWPAGLLADARGECLWFSESWRHRVQCLDLAGACTPVLRNLPGYPGRLGRDPAGGAWLAVFAARTHLVELVLRERKYREEMLATIDPQFWIAPSLHASGHYLEPLQGGALKKLGVVKPWAPPRSYGLVARLSAELECSASLHSRAGGLHHGITAARAIDARLVVVSKGSGRLLDAGAIASAAAKP
ncbi:MAG: SMP-30/gluconolactonase/LRE family protein [Gammaproteobacteria bacterium]